MRKLITFSLNFVWFLLSALWAKVRAFVIGFVLGAAIVFALTDGRWVAVMTALQHPIEVNSYDYVRKTVKGS